MKKMLVYLSIILTLLLNLLGVVNGISIEDMLGGSISSVNFYGLKKSSYPLKRDYIFGNGLFMALPAGFGKIDVYLVKNYDGVDKKWIVQYLATVDGDDVKKLGDRFNSLSFSATLPGGAKAIYTFINNGSGWQIRKVGVIYDSDAIPMEFKDNVLLLKKYGVLKKAKVCVGESDCATFQQNNPDLVDKLVCDTSSPYADENPTCYLTYMGDKIYAYSIKDLTKEFSITNVDKGVYNNVSYDGLYTWANYSQYYNVNYPIKINGMFLYNTDRIGSIKYYNIFTNVNWYNPDEGKTVDQIVMSTIKVYPDAQLSLDELATGNNLVWSGNLSNYRVYMFR